MPTTATKWPVRNDVASSFTERQLLLHRTEGRVHFSSIRLYALNFHVGVFDVLSPAMNEHARPIHTAKTRRDPSDSRMKSDCNVGTTCPRKCPSFSQNTALSSRWAVSSFNEKKKRTETTTDRLEDENDLYIPRYILTPFFYRQPGWRVAWHYNITCSGARARGGQEHACASFWWLTSRNFTGASRKRNPCRSCSPSPRHAGFLVFLTGGSRPSSCSRRPCPPPKWSWGSVPPR